MINQTVLIELNAEALLSKRFSLQEEIASILEQGEDNYIALVDALEENGYKNVAEYLNEHNIPQQYIEVYMEHVSIQSLTDVGQSVVFWVTFGFDADKLAAYIKKEYMTFDIVLKEKPVPKGLTKAEFTYMLGLLPEFTEAYPVEFDNTGSESSAMGFITDKAAEKLDYMTGQNSPIAKYVGSILADTNLESENGEYEFEGLKIYLTR